jgi:arsenate reductase
MMKKKVLFICMHNSARSQIAESFLNTIYGDRFQGFSAGIKPTKVNHYVVKAMYDIGVDLSKHRSKSIEEFRCWNFNYVVTVCNNAKEDCPFFPGDEIIHKSFEDPSKLEGNAEEIMVQVRSIRDEIEDWIKLTFASKC